MRVAAIVLAAGSSSRMGSPKQILQFRGHSLLRRAALAALDAGCDPVVAVTGAHRDVSRLELEGLDVREAFNAHWETGMASSIRTGVESLGDVDAAVLMLCDQPHVTADVITALIATHRSSGKPVIASAYGGSFGVPALFSRAVFTELARLQGAAGAKSVITRYLSDAELVPFAAGEIDVDTPEEFRSAVAGATALDTRAAAVPPHS